MAQSDCLTKGLEAVPREKHRSAADILQDASDTYAERNKVYGNNYERAGAALDALFPDGITLKSVRDHERYQIFSLILVKLSRYANNWEEGGHLDSIHDTAVYAAILEEIDGQ